jgi:hypothetical protein
MRFSYTNVLSTALTKLKPLPVGVTLSAVADDGSVVPVAMDVSSDLSGHTYSSVTPVMFAGFPFLITVTGGDRMTEDILPRIFGPLWGDPLFFALCVLVSSLLVAVLTYRRSRQSERTRQEIATQVGMRTQQLTDALGEKEDLLGRLEWAKLQAEGANKTKSDFLAYLCHGVHLSF